MSEDPSFGEQRETDAATHLVDQFRNVGMVIIAVVAVGFIVMSVVIVRMSGTINDQSKQVDKLVTDNQVLTQLARSQQCIAERASDLWVILADVLVTSIDERELRGQAETMAQTAKRPCPQVQIPEGK